MILNINSAYAIVRGFDDKYQKHFDMKYDQTFEDFCRTPEILRDAAEHVANTNQDLFAAAMMPCCVQSVKDKIFEDMRKFIEMETSRYLDEWYNSEIGLK